MATSKKEKNTKFERHVDGFFGGLEASLGVWKSLNR
jgi:hypothetical protein